MEYPDATDCLSTALALLSTVARLGVALLFLPADLEPARPHIHQPERF